MIFTASYFCPKHHHGKLIPISRGIPSHLRGKIDEREHHDLRMLLAPSAELLRRWRQWEDLAKSVGDAFPSAEAIASYTSVYREELLGVLSGIREYLQTRHPAIDETWLCYEPPGEFCHRNLAYALVEKWRPDCCGGQDAEKTESDLVDGKKYYVPFEVGDRVCLRLVPTEQFIVKERQLCVPLGGTSTRPVPPESESCVNHYYVMKSPKGGVAYWHHSQLSLVQRVPITGKAK